jgi:hypothetical protein
MRTTPSSPGADRPGGPPAEPTEETVTDTTNTREEIDGAANTEQPGPEAGALARPDVAGLDETNGSGDGAAGGHTTRGGAGESSAEVPDELPVEAAALPPVGEVGWSDSAGPVAAAAQPPAADAGWFASASTAETDLDSPTVAMPVPAPGPVPDPGPAAAAPPPWRRMPDADGADEPSHERPAAEQAPGRSWPGVGRAEPAVDATAAATTTTAETAAAGTATDLLDDVPTTFVEPAASTTGHERVGWISPPRGRARVPRRAALQLKRLDPWSVLKLALVLSGVLFLIWMVAVGLLYGVLDGMGVWDRLNGTYSDLVSGGGASSGQTLISAWRVFGYAALFGIINSVLVAVAMTVSAFIYNVSADLVGGIEVTLSERD